MTPFPFFLGRGRSGTTLLRAIFDSHPEVAIPHESHFLVTMGKTRRTYEKGGGGFDVDAFMADLAPTGFARWGLALDEVAHDLGSSPPRDYPEAVRRVYGLYAAAHGKARYADKTPIYVLHIDLLAELFPEARFIHVIRDGRNVALSYLDVDFGPTSLEEAAIYWRRFVNRGRRSGARLGPSRYTEIRYEDLLENPETHVRHLCDFVDLGFDESMLRYFERAGQVVGADGCHRNLYKPPTKGMRDWHDQMDPAALALFEGLAGDLLVELGYERTVEGPSIRQRLGTKAKWMGVQRHRIVRSALKRAGASVGRPPEPDGTE